MGCFHSSFNTEEYCQLVVERYRDKPMTITELAKIIGHAPSNKHREVSKRIQELHSCQQNH